MPTTELEIPEGRYGPRALGYVSGLASPVKVAAQQDGRVAIVWRNNLISWQHCDSVDN